MVVPFSRVHPGARPQHLRVGISFAVPAQQGTRYPAGPCAVHQQDHIKRGPKRSDVIHLGNLCLDVVLEVDTLPTARLEERAQLLASLSEKPPPRIQWKVGGGTNFMITASRLGLRVASCGHVAQDDFGHHLMDVLLEEGISQHVNLTSTIPEDNPILAQTLVCFVLVDRNSREHTFCSRYDFGPWPLLSNFSSKDVSVAIFDHFADTAAVMMNGFVFDELSPDVVSTLARHAHDSGAAVFFDPGPRCSTLVTGSRRAAMEALLSVVSVILVTAEELETLTGAKGIADGCRSLFSLYTSVLKWVVVKVGSEGCILAQMGESGVAYQHQDGHTVEIADTVGCGDSFAAAIVMGYTQGWDPSVALALANAVGACTATREGAGQNVASREHIEAMLNQGCQSLVHTSAQACKKALHKLQSEESNVITQLGQGHSNT